MCRAHRIEISHGLQYGRKKKSQKQEQIQNDVKGSNYNLSMHMDQLALTWVRVHKVFLQSFGSNELGEALRTFAAWIRGAGLADPRMLR